MKLSTAVALVLTTGRLAIADETYTISSSTNWGTWEGWGVSLAWWAKVFGTRTDILNILFSTSSTSYNSASVPGLGLNIVRYNAGACSYNTYDGDSMVESPNIVPSRQIDGYWLDWASNVSTSSSWDWSVDANQRNAMTYAKSKGANRFQLFSNSPMWWMCLNHNPSGASDGSENIQSWNLENHALYLATIAKYAESNWGITFDTVEPFNEPSGTWWTATGTQEGCHIDYDTQSTILGYLRSQLDEQGLTSMGIAASDETSYDQAKTTWSSLTSTAKADIDQIDVHGYSYGDGDRTGLYDDAKSAGKILWNSEYGESDATGTELVSNLILDFRWLHPTAWVYWQAIDGGGWGLIEGDNEAVTLGAVSQKYYALAQFTRHIREGMTILDGGGDSIVAAYDSSSQKLVIVAVNWSTSGQTLTFDLSQFASVPSGASVSSWYTVLGSGAQYTQASSITVSGTSFSVYFNSNVVQTFEITGVQL